MKPLQVPLHLNTGELLNVEEAADRIGMSARYVRRLIAERRIVFYRIGRSIRLDPADLTALVESSRVEPISSASVWKEVRTVAL
jgi:excisionase family DNA binding protein